MLTSSTRRATTAVGVAVVTAGALLLAAAPVRAASLSVVKGYQQVVAEYETNGPTQATGTATCPSGSLVVGGGVGLTSTSSLGTTTSGSRPSSDGSAWVGTIVNPLDAGTDYTVWAVCVTTVPKYTIVTGADVGNPAGSQTAVMVSCPSGTVVLGGGGTLSSTSTSVSLHDSYPVSGGHGWRIDANNTSTGSDKARAYAICGKKPGGFKVRTGPGTAVAAQSTGSDSVNCPSGQMPLGGGGESSSSSVTVNLSSTYPSGRTWSAYASNTSSAASTITAYAICAKA